MFWLTGEQEDEEVTGGGAESAEGSGKGREEGVEEHKWPHMGWDESLRTRYASSPPKAFKTKQTLARVRLFSTHTHFHGFLSDKTGVCLLGGVLPALISPALPAASITYSVVTFPQCRVDGKKTHLIGSHGWCVPCDDTRTVSALLTTVSSVAVQRYISSTLTITKAWDRTCVVWTWTLPFCNLLCYLSFFFFMNLCPAFSARYWRGLCAWKLIFCVLTVVFFLLNSSSRRPEEYQTRTVFVNTARRWAIEINVVWEKKNLIRD